MVREVNDDQGSILDSVLWYVLTLFAMVLSVRVFLLFVSPNILYFIVASVREPDITRVKLHLLLPSSWH